MQEHFDFNPILAFVYQIVYGYWIANPDHMISISFLILLPLPEHKESETHKLVNSYVDMLFLFKATWYYFVNSVLENVVES